MKFYFVNKNGINHEEIGFAEQKNAANAKNRAADLIVNFFAQIAAIFDTLDYTYVKSL